MKKILFLAVLFPALMLQSCDAFLEETPESFLTAESGVVDENFVEASLQGAFLALNWYKNGRQFMIGISGTDEAQAKTVEANYWAEQGALDKYNTSLNSDNQWPKWYWDAGYFGINRSNNTINAARSLTTSPQEWRDSKEAEARWVRAYNYFMLLQHFGDVPLITENTKPSTTPNYPREKQDVVYKFIEDDLLYALNKLKTNYQAGRVTVGAVHALLMKVYMYASPASGYRNYAKAKTQFEELEKLGKYRLVDSYADLYNPEKENSTESVYELQFQHPDVANSLQYYCGSRAIGNTGVGSGYAIFLPSSRYLALFIDPATKQPIDAGDTRYAVSVRTEFRNNKTGAIITSAGDPETLMPHCKKYEDFDRNLSCSASSKNVFLIRYADLVLLYAELLNDEGDLGGAQTQVNRIRSRAGAAPMPAGLSKDQVLDYIYEERMRELGMEGWRRMDLIRRGVDYFVAQVDAYNQFAKGNVKPMHALYPIPKNEINMNNGISESDQNSGYN